MLKLTTYDITKESLHEIKNPKIFEKRRFSADGLFSLQIFGPILSYHCLCKDSFKGPNYPLSTCPKCGVRITTASERDKTYSKIRLPFKVFNPLIFYIVTQNRPALKNALKGLLFLNRDIINPKTGEVLYRSNDLNEIKRYLFDYFSKYKNKSIYNFLVKNENLILIDEILVIPPNFRPCNKLSQGGFVLDKLNEKYLNILKLSSQLQKVIVPLDNTNELYLTNFKILQGYVFELYDYVFEKLSGKTGLIRSNMLGKRVDFSGRAVITPDPTLKLNECAIPYSIVLEILKPKLIPYLVSKRICNSYIDSLNSSNTLTWKLSCL